MGVVFHFLDVGDGDCTIVDFPERIVKNTNAEKNARVMMVDIFHHDDYGSKYEHVIDYYKNNFGNRSIFRFILTHPHKDHLLGIKSLFEESGISIINFWDLEHDFEPLKEGSGWESYKEDWDKYSKIRLLSDDEGLCVRRYWDSQNNILYWNEDKVQILSPSKELHKLAHYNNDGSNRDNLDVDLNNMPYVLLVRVNDLKIVLSSDAEDKCWEYILNNYATDIADVDILKAAHHGRLTGFHDEAVKIMKPKNIVFSCTSETDSDCGAEKEYKNISSGATIYKTCDSGTVVLDCEFDGSINKL